jgi:hypothetical protein
MSFLDNLENNLKSLESAGQAQEDAERQRRMRDEELKNSPFTAELLNQATRIGFSMRTLVRITWLDTTLRLEAKGQRLDLQPTPDGIQAVYGRGLEEMRREPLDLNGNPEELARNWLAGLQ